MSNNKKKKTDQTSPPDTSPSVPQRGKIKNTLSIRPFPWTEKQNDLIELITDKKTKVVFVKGVAGTAKTLIATYCGLTLLNERKISDIMYVRSVVESASRSIGFLKGDNDEKFGPYIAPLEDKLQELLTVQDVQSLVNDNRIHGIPVNFMRGVSWAAKYAIIDESANFTFKELVTIITRLGKFSKFIIIGDVKQADIKDSGFSAMYDLFNDEESKQNGIHCFEFGIQDVQRSEELKYILTKIDSFSNRENVSVEKSQ